MQYLVNWKYDLASGRTISASDMFYNLDVAKALIELLHGYDVVISTMCEQPDGSWIQKIE